MKRYMQTALIVALSAGVGAVTMWVARAGAVGVPAGATTPALVYSGVLLKDGVPVTEEVEIEVGLWDDQTPGQPDTLICGTGEGLLITPDQFGTFQVEMPDADGEGQDGKNCISELQALFAAGRPEVYVQVEINRQRVGYSIDGGAAGTAPALVERLPVSSVPFAIDAERASNSFAGGELQAQIDALRDRVEALEGGGQ